MYEMQLTLDIAITKTFSYLISTILTVNIAFDGLKNVENLAAWIKSLRGHEKTPHTTIFCIQHTSHCKSYIGYKYCEALNDNLEEYVGWFICLQRGIVTVYSLDLIHRTQYLIKLHNTKNKNWKWMHCFYERYIARLCIWKIPTHVLLSIRQNIL